MKSHTNNFGFLRLVAALAVIVSHDFGFLDRKDPLQLMTGELSLGTLGVYVFFLISGFLITKSWLRNPNLKIYITNRILRIFPGLIAVVLFIVFIIGPVFSTLTISDYFLSADTYKYFWNISLIKLNYYLPGVFIYNGKQHVINAPLWTLVFEFLMYIITAFFGLCGFLDKKSKWFYVFLTVYFFFVVISFIKIPSELFLFKIHVKSFADFYLYFFSGALVFLFYENIYLKAWHIIPLFAIYLFSINTNLFTLATLLLTTHTVFYIAFYTRQLGKIITDRGDFSYGLYLYGYVIQNITHGYITDTQNVIASITLSILITIPFAVISWYCIESQALKLKDMVALSNNK